jgi:molybdopterin-guanine dinucleotide biosynthesis protein A
MLPAPRFLMRKGAIVLCGGKSSRMGRDKATLPFGPELMLQRAVRLLSESVALEDMLVVAAPNQLLPDLPGAVRVTCDSREFRGPLQGLATGLREIGDRFDAIYATACDVPLLAPAFIDRMFQLLGEYDVAVPFDGEHHHSLAAVYRSRVLPHIEALLDADRLRPRFLFDLVRTLEVPVDDLRNVDPQLATLENLNQFDDYLAALAAAGFNAPVETGEPHDHTL